MKATEAHGRVIGMIDRGELDEPLIATDMPEAPAVAAALAALSGQLDDAQTDSDLRDAIRHGASLFEAGVIDAAAWGEECKVVMQAVASEMESAGGEELGVLFADLPPELLDCTLSNFRAYHRNATDALAKLGAYLDMLPPNLQTGLGLSLAGPPGTGKGHLIVGLAREAIARYGLTIRFLQAAEFASRLGLEQVVSAPALQAADVLIVDGFRPEHLQGDEMIRRILLARMIEGKVNWLATSVRGRADAIKLLGPEGLLTFTTAAECVACCWPSYRLLGPERISQLRNDNQ